MPPMRRRYHWTSEQHCLCDRQTKSFTSARSDDASRILVNEAHLAEIKRVQPDLDRRMTWVLHRGIPYNLLNIVMWIRERLDDQADSIAGTELPAECFNENICSLTRKAGGNVDEIKGPTR